MGALVMTITFTVHVQNDAIIDASIGIRYAYLLAAGCSSALALAGTVIAVRTIIIMININKAADVPQLLNYVYHQRLNSQFHRITSRSGRFFHCSYRNASLFMIM